MPNESSRWQSSNFKHYGRQVLAVSCPSSSVIATVCFHKISSEGVKTIKKKKNWLRWKFEFPTGTSSLQHRYSAN